MMKRIRILFGATLLATALAGAALAQSGPEFDPQQLPAIQGKVVQYSLSPRGDVDGLILDDGTEVHLPPHLGAQLVFAVKPGDRITVHGLKARAIAVVQAASVTNDATGATVVDDGPGGPQGPRDRGQPLSAQGHNKSQLHGPRGDLNGVLLEDGTIIRLPPDEAERLADQLSPGQPLYVEGEGVAGPLGKVIAAQRIGPNQSQLAQVQEPPLAPSGRRPDPREPSPPPPPPR
jgi:hypothetical protein